MFILKGWGFLKSSEFRRLSALAGMAFLFLAYAQTADGADTPKVDPALCRSLVQHTPDASVEYRPGVDVNGNPIAPADVAGTPQVPMLQPIKIPLTVGLANVLHLNTTQYPYSQLGTGTEAVIGTITVNGNNVLLNGQPLTDTQQDNLAVLCMKPNK